MVNNTVISFNHVGKRYNRNKRLLLKQALLDIFQHDQTETFWALHDISFTINRGETIGILGINGSGKSTILKLIAGVIVPTKGTVTVRGRISPLIELGAGFHPELSGRDNIYLNGTILGLPQKEIDEKFDDIVAFSELGDFIDSPVKHYSSGMYMRLGFSVAVNVDPEILLIDEILSVGDTRFQRKCMAKMKSFKSEDRTIILVSHSLDTLKSFCERVILISEGKLIDIGKPEKIIQEYNHLLGDK